MSVHLEQPRVVLRDWKRTDLEAYETWLQPGHTWQSLDGPYYPAMTALQVAARIEMLRERIPADL